MNAAILGEVTWQTLLMTLISVVFAYVIGLPLGILIFNTSKKGLHPNRPVHLILGAIVNILRSVPCLLLIILLKPLTQLIFGSNGWTTHWYAMIVPLVFASFGFVARIVETSLAEIDAGAIEMARSIGASNVQIVMKVLLPEARSSLVSGLALTTVNIIGYTSFAGYISAGGLVEQAFTYGYYGNNTLGMWVCILIVVLLVELFQEGGLLLAKKIDKRKIAK